MPKILKYMEARSRILEEINEKGSAVSQKQALVGLDGFVDLLMQPVRERSGPGDDFTPMARITEFADRIARAAGKSTNIEWVPIVEKIGGNGPIMSHALVSFGMKVRYIGTLGHPNVHPVLEEFARKTDAVSIADPGISHAAEFEDGKIMFGKMDSLDAVTFDRIVEIMTEGMFYDAISRAHLISWVNWTMIPYMTQFFVALLDRVLPNVNTLEPRQFFFDLADPSKRTRGDLRGVLQTIKRFQSFGNVTLGLNLSEAQQVERVLFDRDAVDEIDETALRKQAERIRNALDIGCVVIHPTQSAACATRDNSCWTEGPYYEKPKISTGAGDHFNAGFATGRLIGLSPKAALTLAVATSGYYVRNAKSPSLHDIDSFIRNWD